MQLIPATIPSLMLTTEATEEDILNNTVADDDEDDEMDDEEDNVRPSDDVTPELETVIDLIEQLRQNRADEE